MNSLNDNLNSAAAFALIDNSDLSIKDWQTIDELFGLDLIKDSPDISDAQKQLIEDRKKARENKDYQKSDELRIELEKQGITVKDTKNGPIWQYLN